MARSQKNNQKEKLSQKEKQQMKKENEKMKEQVKSIVLPTLGAIVFLIFAYVFVKTRSIPIQVASGDE